jgi:hypothetical protein
MIFVVFVFSIMSCSASGVWRQEQALLIGPNGADSLPVDGDRFKPPKHAFK